MKTFVKIALLLFVIPLMTVGFAIGFATGAIYDAVKWGWEVQENF